MLWTLDLKESRWYWPQYCKYAIILKEPMRYDIYMYVLIYIDGEIMIYNISLQNIFNDRAKNQLYAWMFTKA